LRALEIDLVGLEEVLSKADVVSLHAPAVAATHHMINAQSLALMKPTAFLINVARGELVDETALIHALESGQIAGAGLDVRDSEPPQLGKLETLPNVVLAPHVAGITNESQRRITDILAQEIARALAGEPLQFAVGRTKK
jgi:phosphoglycerate dehydrogenase-like enzyme